MIEESVTIDHAVVTPPRRAGLVESSFEMTGERLRISHVSVSPLCIELTEPFGVAGGAQPRADNVLVEVALSDGSVGLGEAAPFPAVNGETQAAVLERLEHFAPSWVGATAGRWRERCREAALELEATPSGACALQSALLDAWLKSHRASMWEFFGGQEAWLESDLTIVTGSVAHGAQAARRARSAGFTTLKVKVGGGEVGDDVRRLRAIVHEAPDASLVLDANAGFSADQALALLGELGELKQHVRLYEQPTVKDDLDAMKKVMIDGRVDVAADESARDARDVVAIATHRAASVINIKVTKSGLLEALDMIQLAKSHGLKLMIGGMVESKLCMCVSACIAAGFGGFEWVDLDTPLFMKESPLVGGYEQVQSRLRVDVIELGHGVRWRQPSPARGSGD